MRNFVADPRRYVALVSATALLSWALGCGTSAPVDSAQASVAAAKSAENSPAAANASVLEVSRTESPAVDTNVVTESAQVAESSAPVTAVQVQPESSAQETPETAEPQVAQVATPQDTGEEQKEAIEVAQADSVASEKAEPVLVAFAKPAAAIIPAVTDPGFQFPVGASGVLLRESLVSSRQTPLPPITATYDKRPWPDTRLREPAPPLPLADAARPTRILADEQPVSAPLRPVVDQPQLFVAVDSQRPARPTMIVMPLAQTIAPDPEAPPALAIVGRQKDSGPSLADDPTAAPLLEWMLRPLPIVRTTPAGLPQQSIPDPYEHLRSYIRRRVPPPTDAAPSTTAPLPGKPTL